MNSALKPVLPQPGVPQAGGQSSPAKGNVASVNHSVGHPQGAQNSLHHNTNSLVGQNLIQHSPSVPQLPPHAVPSMAPVSANMAQMAQNMSHHGNLSHVTQNSVAPANTAASPTKTTSAPISLVPQPLALTRTPDKKEPDSSSQSNGTVESPKSAVNAPTALKPQNPEPNNDKQDIAKTSPSTPKPPEKPTSSQSTPQKPEGANPGNQTESLVQPKVATPNELPEKSSSKPVELKPAPTADVAPTQSDKKPVPESANASQCQDKTPPKPEPIALECAKVESPAVPESKKDEAEVPVQVPKPQIPVEEKKAENVDKTDGAKKEEPTPKVEEKPIKPEETKPESKSVKPSNKPAPKSTLKLATVTTPMRKRRHTSPNRLSDGPSPAKKAAEGDSTPDSRLKRNRTKVQLYQSPTPEIAMATKLSASAGRATPTKPTDDKLIVFYKNEYLAVRNTEGSFYVCQALQNVYRNSRKIKIRWLSQDKTSDPSGETYKPDFYDVTDKECVLTTLSLARAPAGGAFVLRAAEAARAASILKRALAAEQGAADHRPLTEEHPDGLDLSLYKDESQLEKKRKRNSSKSSPRKLEEEETVEEVTPSKKARTQKRSPKSARITKTTPQTKQNNNKRKSAGSTPQNVASTSKTATAVTEQGKGKTVKRTPGKSPGLPLPVAPVTLRTGRRFTKVPESNLSPMVATPSTSTGKPTRSPRKPHK